LCTSIQPANPLSCKYPCEEKWYHLFCYILDVIPPRNSNPSWSL
jgi:hypothetical protein